METKEISTGNLVLHEPLTDGVTNQSYKATWNNKLVAYRRGREQPEIFGINRELEKQFFQTASFLNISPRLLSFKSSTGEQITQFLKGRHPLSCELEEKIMLGKIIEIIKTYHKLNSRGKRKFDGSSRIQLLETHYVSLKKHIHNIPLEYDIHTLMNTAKSIDSLISNDDELVFSHKDLYVKNILIDQTQKIWLLDWEYANWCNKYYDLATLVTKNLLSDRAKEQALEIYFGKVTEKDRFELDICCAIVSLQTAFWCLIQMFIFDCKNLNASLCKETAKFRVNEFKDLSLKILSN